MGGELNFAMTMDVDRMVQNTERANATVRRFRISVDDINKAFDRAAKEGNQQLGRSVQATTKSLQAMEGVMMVFGGQVAPQLTSGILTITSGLSALRATSQATGIALTSIGVAGLGVVGILATLTAAVDFARAKLDEGDIEHRTIESLIGNRDSLMKRIQDLAMKGKLTKDQAIQMQIQLALAPSSVEAMYDAVRAVQNRLTKIVGPAKDLNALVDYQSLERATRASTMTGKDRALADLDIQVIDLSDKLEKLGKAAGVTKEEQMALVNEFAAARRKEIDAQFAPKQEKVAPSTYRTSLTGLEKLGLVISTGVRGTGFEPERLTAENTRQMLTEQKTTNKLLASTGGNSFARI